MIHLSSGAGFWHPGVYEHVRYVFYLVARGDLRSGTGRYGSGAVRDSLSFVERELIMPDRPGVSLVAALLVGRAWCYRIRTDRSAVLDSHPAEHAALSSIPLLEDDDSYP